MLRSIAELAAYGTLAALLTAASFTSQAGALAGSASTSADTTATSMLSAEAAADRGALLFATNGCVGCHIHAAFPNAHMQVGPELTGLPLRAATRVAGLDCARLCTPVAS